MIVIRYGGPIVYQVYVISSMSISDADLQKRVKEVLNVEAKLTSFVTKSGRRSEEVVFDLSGYSVIKIINLIGKLKKVIQNVVIQHYEYNDRFDSPKFEVPPPAPESLPEPLEPVVALAFEYMKRYFLKGRIAPSTIDSASELILLANQWGPEACKEVAGLLLARFLNQNIPAILYHNLATEFEKRNITEADHMFLAFVLDAAKQMSSFSIDADIACWKALLQALLVKNWQSHFNSFADLDRQCRFFERCPKSARSNLFPVWVIDPLREVILGYIRDPDISHDEFVDLAALIPPPGFSIFRRLSNTSAFKVVYRAQDDEGNLVALKRYKRWEDDRMKQVLSRLGLTEEKVKKRDMLAHWLGNIRHTHILPCRSVKNEKDELFIVEPLLDATLDNITIHEPKEVIRRIREVVEAVAYLHDKGWVHSDIKPDNIGIEKDKAVLLDFGIASCYSPDSHTRSNPGSIKTRAPELFSETAVPTFASDVWAIGATLMALVSGGEYPLLSQKEVERLPPAGDSKRIALEQQILSRIKQYQLNPLILQERIIAAFPKEFSPLLEPVLQACQLNPEQRPSAKKLIELFDRAMDLA